MDVNETDYALWWTGGTTVDADGDPAAYKPGGGGDDALGNAGHPGDWYGLACDEKGEPYVQGPSDPDPGYYVAQTALVDHTKAIRDPARYVDSARIRYISVPKELIASHGGPIHLGDAVVCHYAPTNFLATGVVAEVGPGGKYGEMSIAMAKALGLKNPSPRNGGAPSGVTFVIFKGTSKGWPRTQEDVAQQAQDSLNANGGPGQYGLG